MRADCSDAVADIDVVSRPVASAPEAVGLDLCSTYFCFASPFRRRVHVGAACTSIYAYIQSLNSIGVGRKCQRDFLYQLRRPQVGV